MERRTLLAGGGAVIALGAGWVATRPDPDTGLLPGAANAQTTDGGEIVDMVLNPEATVEVIEYASFTCPHCATFHANQYQQLKTNFIDTGKIRFVFREVYFDRPGLWASMIARCSGQLRFFGLTELLFEKQREWLASGDPATIIDDLRRLAKTAGLDDATLDACMSDGEMAQSLVDWYEANAKADDIRSTPSFVIDGEKYSNMAYQEFESVLNAKLGG